MHGDGGKLAVADDRRQNFREFASLGMQSLSPQCPIAYLSGSLLDFGEAPMLLIKRGVRVITTSGDDLTEATDPSRVMMRQIAGSFAQYEKARLVRKLREARERSGKLGGRKSYAEAQPDTVALVKQLRAQGLSYRKIAVELAAHGHLTGSRKPHVASAIQKMLKGKVVRSLAHPRREGRCHAKPE
jgi:DNA invertase Pin-like site-specific DNA recombinase